MAKPTKVIPYRNYGSIPHLLGSKLGKHDKYIHEGQDRIIRNGGRDKHDVVIVSLKLDGTNVGVTKIDGKIITLQRKGYDCASSPYRQHHEFDKWVHENYGVFDSLLHEGDRIVGEWLWQASGIKYKIAGAPFFAFDYFPYYGDGKKRMSYAAMVEFLEVNEYPFEMVPFLSYTKGQDMEPGQDGAMLLDLACGAEPYPLQHEGYVYRVERKGKFDFAAKWVRPDFEPGKYLSGIGLPEGAEPVQNIPK